MPERNRHTPKPLKSEAASSGEGTAVIVDVCKALKALAFYPEGHPLRNEMPRRAYQSLTNLMKGEAFSLVAGRGGLKVYGRSERVENTRMVKAFADELFAREIQRLTFLPGFAMADLTLFLSVLSMEPQKILAEGGIRKLLSQRGLSGVMVNEIDISAAFTKRMSGDGAGAEGAGTGGEHDFDWEGTPFEEIPVEPPDDLTIDELLAQMERETDADLFLSLSRRVVAKGRAMEGEDDFDALFRVILRLLNLSSNDSIGETRRRTAFEAFRELASGGITDHLLDHLQDSEFGLKEIVYMIFSRMGEDAVSEILPRLVETDNPSYSKTLGTALLRIGEPAVHALIGLLRDARSHVVRAAAAVLGEMGARDAVKGLARNLSHADGRVRIESVRSLAMIGGKEATELLVGLMRDKDPVMRRQAVLWLGIQRNTKALQPLLRLVVERSYRPGAFALKRDALRAVGRIGDHSALDLLCRLVRKRHFIMPGRWEELKLLAIDIIGQSGGETASAFLEKMAVKDGPLGRKCAEALQNARGDSRRQP